MNSYKYDFSVVMAIYDVEEFLEEARNIAKYNTYRKVNVM